ncbi:MAG: CHAT domain-containing protein [Acidobacteriota bacterium]
MNAGDHPELELLGAFLEGKVSIQERDALVRHLSVCETCIDFLRGAHAAAGESGLMTEIAPRFARRPWALVAASVLLAALGLTIGPRLYRHVVPPKGVEALIAALPVHYRTIEPRLTGFPWAELRQLRDGEEVRTDEESLRLAGAAGGVLHETQGDPSAPARRAAGVAALLVRDTGRASEELRNATERDSQDAAAWNDLAAALYTSAVQNRRAADLPLALAAADRAVALDASQAEARFNRALILERIGLRDEAAAAWQELLALEPASPWAAEARRHAAGLAKVPTSRFRDRIETLERAASGGNLAAVERELREFPQEVRGWFEVDVLGRWGEAESRGDAAAAEGLLSGARTVGAALQSASGESLLADAVVAIERARGDRRAALARAHGAYRAGRLSYRDYDLVEAERQLRAAASAFEIGGSPMDGLSRTYVASVIFDQNRIDEAAALVEPVVSRSGSHIALHAQASALLGRCHAYSCRWSGALRHYNEALQSFRRVGETSNVAESENAIGEIYSNAGEIEKAWRHRLAALEILGAGRFGPRLLAALATDARGELRSRRWESARSLLRLEIAEAQRGGDPLLVADAYKRRARLNADRDAMDAARADLREARGFASRAANSGLRERFAAECALVDGIVERKADAARSVVHLTAAIDFARASGDRRLLPEALLERARTFLVLNGQDQAMQDLAEGIAGVDERRGTADGGPGATFDAESDLLDEAIALLLARGDNKRAFAYAERAHARALLDAMDLNVPRQNEPAWPDSVSIAAALPPGTTLVQYALLPHSVAIFWISDSGLHVSQQPIERAALEADVRALRTQIETRAPIEQVLAPASRLHALLIAPLGDDAAQSLVIVGDRVLQSVPWAALWNAGNRQFLVERSAVSVAPSAGIWLRNRFRKADDLRRDRLLLVTSDAREKLDPLNDLRREASAIQSGYSQPLVLADGEATPDRFLAEAAGADVVHYAGHARASSDVREAALLLAGNQELVASRIAAARLPRTRLVVLAACGTLAGDTSGLEGSPGLARAFLAAGVPAVAGTLWPVQDADAAILFVAFHERLRSGSAVAAALREAQLTMLRGPVAERAHPAAWAAAEILGSGQ